MQLAPQAEDQRAWDITRALAAGQLGEPGVWFAKRGIAAQVPVPGVLRLGPGPGKFAASRPRLLLSVGVHGDETAPIELLGGLLARLLAAPTALAAELMVAVGNPAAIAARRRYLDIDLNRLFRAGPATAAGPEGVRATQLMAATDAFFAGAAGPRWHLDLHTTIRPSRYPRFAVVPVAADGVAPPAMLAWLGAAALDAAILNPLPASTYSAYSARMHAAAAATLELGQVGALGHNDLSPFVVVRDALWALLAGDVSPPPTATALFRVTQEVVKQSASFELMVGSDAPNFTRFAQGALVAQDGVTETRACAAEEFIVFPNPDVAIGRRAGLLVCPVPGVLDSEAI